MIFLSASFIAKGSFNPSLSVPILVHCVVKTVVRSVSEELTRTCFTQMALQELRYRSRQYFKAFLITRTVILGGVRFQGGHFISLWQNRCPYSYRQPNRGHASPAYHCSWLPEYCGAPCDSSHMTLDVSASAEAFFLDRVWCVA